MQSNSPCTLCRGACCESIVAALPPGDAGRWLAYHGTPLGDGRVELCTSCQHLSAGRCAIHEYRPDACRTYEVGGAECRLTVARRRPAEAPAIFAAMDRPTSALPDSTSPILP